MEGLRSQQLERKRTGIQRLIGQILVDQGHLSQDQLRDAIASWLGEYVVHPEHLQPDATALALVPRDVAERESVLPLLARDDALVVLMADPYDRTLLDELRFLTQRRLLPLQAALAPCCPPLPRPTAYPGQPVGHGTVSRGRPCGQWHPYALGSTRLVTGAGAQPEQQRARERRNPGRRGHRVRQHPGAPDQLDH